MTQSATFVVEIGCEELPPLSLPTLQAAFVQHIQQGLTQAQIGYSALQGFATPRRLAVSVQNLANQPQTREELRLGPSIEQAWHNNQPTAALLGFARSLNVSVEQLTTFDTEKGLRVGFAQKIVGQSTIELLPLLIQHALQQLPVARAMHWGANRITFVRPVRWLLMLFGNQVVEANILGLKADRLTYGHRIHCPHAISLEHANDYIAQLETVGYVIADWQQRRQIIENQIHTLAEEVHVKTQIDETLLDEVSGLVEWPQALLGHFDSHYLQLPQACLISSMQNNQKYFPLFDNNGQLQPAFITIANLASRNPAQVIQGNERVIRPRLADAMFFYQTDLASPLSARCAQLEAIIFQRRLGTLADKSRRLVEISNHICQLLQLAPEPAQRAAQLAKCDLVTQMVQEFPELQGIMGEDYALHSGESAQVAKAIGEQYLPRNASDHIPHSNYGVVLALADRLDTLTGIFGIGQRPSGTKDPFALRRAAIGILKILIEGNYPLDLKQLVIIASNAHSELNEDERQSLIFNVFDYIQERFKVWTQEQGFSNDIYQAVQAIQITNPVDFFARMRALQTFLSQPIASALIASSKRVHNLLAQQQNFNEHLLIPSLFNKEAEKTLHTALIQAKQHIIPILAVKNYEQIWQILSSLPILINHFFDEVMIIDPDEKIRHNRLALLTLTAKLLDQVANLAKINL